MNNPAKCPPTLNSMQTALAMSNYALWPTLGMLFHPIYSIVNAKVVAGFDDPIQMAALGLGSLTTGIMLVSICSCFCLVVGTFVAPAYGDEEMGLAKRYVYRQFYLNTLVYIVTIIPLFWINDIYLAIGQDPEVAEYATQYVRYLIPGIYFHV